MKIRNSRSVAIAAAGIVFALPLAACSSSSDDTTAGTTSSSSATAPSESSSAPADTSAAAPFGDGCAQVPASGAGSFDGMAQEPVATAASANPLLSTLVTAVTEAGLVDTLNGTEDITVFAPSNDAFQAMDQDVMKKAMADPKGLLSMVLTYHVVPGRLTPQDLVGTHKTLQGGELTVAQDGEDFVVDTNAKVICGNVQTANATVYIIDQVLMPKM